jgi:hypothetical protein
MWYTLRMVLAILALRFLRWMKPVLFFLLIVWAILAFGGGKAFDSVCIEGRLSAEQARVLSSMEWGHCPSYRNGSCVAEENDRVFVGQCSEASKFLTQPRKWIKSMKSGEFPWQY